MSEERKSVCYNAQYELRKDGDKPVIRLLASVFNSLSEDLGGFREIIRKGAFDATLKDVADGKRDVAARIQHDGGMTTIGRVSNGTLRLWTDDDGLWADITPPDTQIGRDIVTLVRDGYINKASFAFMPRELGQSWNWEADPPVRTITDVDLFDVAPVDGPAYEATSAQVREGAMKDLAEVRRLCKIRLGICKRDTLEEETEKRLAAMRARK